MNAASWSLTQTYRELSPNLEVYSRQMGFTMLSFREYWRHSPCTDLTSAMSKECRMLLPRCFFSWTMSTKASWPSATWWRSTRSCLSILSTMYLWGRSCKFTSRCLPTTCQSFASISSWRTSSPNNTCLSGSWPYLQERLTWNLSPAFGTFTSWMVSLSSSKLQSQL